MMLSSLSEFSKIISESDRVINLWVLLSLLKTFPLKMLKK
jgi:hypothetical protein